MPHIVPKALARNKPYSLSLSLCLSDSYVFCALMPNNYKICTIAGIDLNDECVPSRISNFVSLLKKQFLSFIGFLTQNAFVIVSVVQPKESSPEEDANKTLNNHSVSMMTYSHCEEEDIIQMSHHVVNKLYYREEIKRPKVENPEMAHKEAFSTTTKNWCKGDEESCSQTKQLVDLD
ncbi:Axial regulator YABBY 4 [Glycine max]|nr:Axial regulator YABBY 4 [Glycine max]